MIIPSLTITHPKGPPIYFDTFSSANHIASRMNSSYHGVKPDLVV